jgi:hypothetical protein
MNVKAKFYVSSVAEQAHSPGQRPPDSKVVRLAAATGQGNEQWSRWTPSGTIEMTINNPAAYEQFQVGQYVEITFESVPFAETPPSAQ